MRSFLVCCVLSIIFIPTVHADESALAAAPAIIEGVVSPDQPSVKEIQVTNTTSFPLPIKGQPAAFLTAQSIHTSAADTFNAAAWITLEPADFILQPHSSQIIHVTITAPPGAEPGGHYATIYFSPLIPKEAVSPDTARGLARIGILTFLIVPGDLHQELAIKNLSIPRFSTFGPVNIEYSLQNNGNVHTLPTGHVTITNLISKKGQEIPLDPAVVLPGTARDTNHEWGTRLMVGHYEAHIELQNPTESQSKIVSESIEFYVFPWPLALGLILVLTLFYQMFIVNGKRIKLAWRVLRGHSPNTGE